MQKYITLVPRFDYPAGTVVVKFNMHDYGCARDDTYITGSYHVSVTADLENKGYPFFTIREDNLIPYVEYKKGV